MPYYVVIGAILLLLLTLGIHWFIRADPTKMAKSLKILISVSAVAVFLSLMLTGKLFVFLTGILAMLPVINFIKNLWIPSSTKHYREPPRQQSKPRKNNNNKSESEKKKSKTNHKQQQKKQQNNKGTYRTKPGEMTYEQAMAVLGLSSIQSQNDIKVAHKKLIQKLHPDKGGSSTLAAQVNEAKDILNKYWKSTNNKTIY